MKYLLCPKQYQAQQGIMRGFSDNVFTIWAERPVQERLQLP